jgi:acyl dehydratase
MESDDRNGTAEVWRSWIGRSGDVRECYYPVSLASIGYFNEMTGDRNPLYYDSPYARASKYAGAIAPPTFITTAARTPTWWPGTEPPEHSMLSLSIPLDISMRINVSVEQHFYRALRVGDEVLFQNTITDITPKTTRLGSGYFIAEEIRFWNQDDDDIARVNNVSFAYHPAAPVQQLEALADE